MDKLLIKILKKIINNSPLKHHYDYTYHTQKYSLDDILVSILYVLKTGIAWRYCPYINWNTVYKHFRNLSKLDIFKSTYVELLRKYIKKTPSRKLKIQITDTTVIKNKYGIDKVKINKHNNNKNVMKVSVITDINGIPLNISTFSGNTHDSKIIVEQIRNEPMLIDNVLLELYSKYFLADKGYDSSIVRSTLINSGYEPIIACNIRNTKCKQKIKKLTPLQKEIYKKRIIVECFFGTLKRSYRRLDNRYDKYSCNYMSFLYLAVCMNICKYM